MDILVHLSNLANKLDQMGLHSEATILDTIIKTEAKTKYKTWKGKKEKPPAGAAHKAPKAWWDEQVSKVKKKNPDYSSKRVSEIVGDIWDNQLSDAKRSKIYKEHGKHKNPNK